MSYNRTNITTLDQVCEVIDSLHKSPKYVESGYPMIRVKDMFQGYLKIDNPAYVTKEVYEEFTRKHKPKKGDILFSRVGSYGITTFVDKDIDFCLGQNTVVMTNYNNEIIDNIFLYYMLISNIVKEQIEKLVTGSTQKTISMKSIKGLELPLPNITEQKAIADILSSLDDKIELNNQMNETLEEMAQALFKRWFVDFEFPNEEGQPYKSSGGEMVESELGLIPKGWEICSLGNIIKLLMGLSPKSDTYNTVKQGIPLLNGAADFNGVDIVPTKYTTDPKRICKVGDILFCIRGTIGNVTFADREYCLGRGVAAISASNSHDLGLVYHTVNRKIEELKLNAKGSVIVGISKDDINNIKIVLADKDNRIKYNDVFNSIYARIKSNNEQNIELKNLRDTLLPKLMSGEIRVSDLC